MTEKILGFTGGGVSGFVAWITGWVNLENATEVFIITLIGGIGGVLGNLLGKWFCHLLKKKIKCKNCEEE